jgi:hypothetical protein
VLYQCQLTSFLKITEDVAAIFFNRISKVGKTLDEIYECEMRDSDEGSISHTGNGQNNGNIRHYRNKTMCVGSMERILVVSIFLFIILFFTLFSAVSMQ